METNGNGRNGDRRNGGDAPFGPFTIKARQRRAFYALTFIFSALIIAFMAWESAVSGEARTWHAVVAGMLRDLIWNGIRGGLIALVIINLWEVAMGDFNPFEVLGVGQGPKWMRERAARLRAEAMADAVAEAEARGREMAYREMGISPPDRGGSASNNDG